MNAIAPSLAVTSITRRLLRCGLAVALSVSFIAACGDDANNSDKLADKLIHDAATAPASNDGTASAPATSLAASQAGDSGNVSSSPAKSDAGAVTHSIDKIVWWGGFKISIASATDSSNALGATIDIAISFENLTTDVKHLDRNDIVLTVGNQSYLSGIARTPDVPAASRNDAVLDFLVDDTFVFDNALLTFGRPDTNQAIVPFGAQAPTTVEPQQLAVDATLTTPLEKIHLTGGTIDASYEAGDKGVFVVRLPMVASYTGASAGGDLILPSQFALRSPSGSSVVASPIAPGDVIAEPAYPGSDVTGKTIAFKVKAIDPGTWTVMYTDSAGTTDTAEITVS